VEVINSQWKKYPVKGIEKLFLINENYYQWYLLRYCVLLFAKTLYIPRYQYGFVVLYLPTTNKFNTNGDISKKMEK